MPECYVTLSAVLKRLCHLTLYSYCPQSVLILLHAASVLWHVCNNSLLCQALAGMHIKCRWQHYSPEQSNICQHPR